MTHCHMCSSHVFVYIAWNNDPPMKKKSPCIILYHIITCVYIFMLCSYYYNLVMIMFLPNYYTLRWLGRPGRVWWISWLWLSRVSCCGAKKYHGRKDWKWKFGDNSDWLCFIDMILVMLHLIIHSISHVNSFSWL